MRIMLAAFVLLAGSTFALAQSTPADQQPPAASPAPGSQAAPPAATQPPATTPPQQQRRNRPNHQALPPDGKPRTVNDCRALGRSQNLQGDTLRFYLKGCRREVASACRQQAEGQGLQGDARREFIRSCAGVRQNARRGGGSNNRARQNMAPSPDADDDLDDQN